MSDETPERTGVALDFTDRDLLYSATARCRCGSGLAYPLDPERARDLSAWACARLLRGEIPANETYGARDFMGAVSAPGPDHELFSWAFFKVREETSINNHGGHTTRPPGTIARTVGRAVCGRCQHTWESEPYSACGASRHWVSGPCPNCGNDCGAGNSWSSSDPRPRIEVRLRDVVLDAPPAAESEPQP